MHEPDRVPAPGMLEAVAVSDLARITGRVAAILDVLDDRPISVRALAAEVSVPKSTAQRMLVALAANGRAERTARGWIAPSPGALFASSGKDDV